MDRLITIFSRRPSLLSTHKVLRNTYFLLSLTLAFSTFTATTSTVLHLPAPGLILTMVGFYFLLFLTHRLSNQPAGILATFALTGFMGYTLGPLLSMLLYSGSKDVILLSLGGTALVFFCCSAYVLTTKRNMSFLSGMLITGFVVLTIAIIANLFLHIAALSLTISIMSILFSAGTFLWETNNIIQNGETNYIRATVSIYVSLYNIFVNLLNIFTINRNHN
ncbi:Bax inhibitor-1 family protein [Candidatus Hoaglandella endobia]|uniref:Modulator of FtsH protease YccA n=1 Tax=Candidatus Hoaglandella endobia TaxID=1778263 RepID=A0A143WUK5_9ENTR|nr:Bax inhibitor-1 family protein [Candidatus Hoaglandella endobia]CUX97276.1 Modulator of FtsH protease YccA [Candidatus Hoaglandella endobia]